MADLDLETIFQRISRPGRTKQLFRPYAAQIGQIAIAWNQLHENLCKIFIDLATPTNAKIGALVWYSTDNDYSQRKMLRAAATAHHSIGTKERQSITWMLDRIDDTLRHNRNNAIHAPLVVMQRFTSAEIKAWVQASTDSESPRAKSLAGKELKAEFKEYADLANALSGYARRILSSMRHPSRYAWPDKPDLPHAHQRTKSRRSSGK